MAVPRFNMGDKRAFFQCWIESSSWNDFVLRCWNIWSKEKANHPALDAFDKNWRTWKIEEIPKFMDKKVYTKAIAIKKSLLKKDKDCGVELPKGADKRYGTSGNSTSVSEEELIKMWKKVNP